MNNKSGQIRALNFKWSFLPKSAYILIDFGPTVLNNGVTFESASILYKPKSIFSLSSGNFYLTARNFTKSGNFFADELKLSADSLNEFPIFRNVELFASNVIGDSEIKFASEDVEGKINQFDIKKLLNEQSNEIALEIRDLTASGMAFGMPLKIGRSIIEIKNQNGAISVLSSGNKVASKELGASAESVDFSAFDVEKAPYLNDQAYEFQ